MPSTALNALTYLALTSLMIPIFQIEKTEAQRRRVTCPKRLSQEEAVPSPESLADLALERKHITTKPRYPPCAVVPGI